MQVSSCTFSHNILSAVPYSKVISASGIVMKSITGAIIIKNCKFMHSFSKTNINYFSLEARSVVIQNCVFQNSSYFDNVGQLENNLMLSNGGFMYLSVQNLVIDNCRFEQSAVYSGGALEISTFGNQGLVVLITNCYFASIYSQSIGSVMSISSVSSNLDFKCVNLTLVNIY